MSATSLVPAVERASKENIQALSSKLGLNIADDDIAAYQAFVNAHLDQIDLSSSLEEETLPVKYPRLPGIIPKPEENIHNAWARKMEIRGAADGILAGKKVVIKDNVAVAGTPMDNGSKIWKGYTPEYDATMVTRILDAGGIIVGKSTCENQCFSGNSFTSASGPVLNPHDITKSAGGSSSGSAVLVATGEVDMAIGGDQGGSIRLPSCWSGIVGLKPTHGLVPTTGALGMEPTFDHVGPMARTVQDVAVLLEAIAGYDEGRDGRQRADVQIPKYSQLLVGNLQGKRFGFVSEGNEGVTPAVQSQMSRIEEKITAAGGIVETVSVPEHKAGAALFAALLPAFYHSMVECNGQNLGQNGWYSTSAFKHALQANKTMAHDCQPTMKGVILMGEYVKQMNGYQSSVRAMNQRFTLRKAYDRELDKFDVLIMPTIPYTATELPKPGISVHDWIKETLSCVVNTGQFDLTGHPAININIGKSEVDGMPVGLQLIGKHFMEKELLDISYGVEQLK